MKSTFDNNTLIKSISLFEGSDTWYEFKEHLRSHPELLGNECDGLLENLINDTNEDNRGEVLSRKIFLELRALFSRSKREGVESALAMTEQMYRDEIDRIWNVIATLKLPEEMHDMSILCRKALYLMTLLKLEKGRDWATIQFELGESLAQIPDGNLPQNIEDAIVAYKFALEAMNQKVDRHLWMAIMVSLGIAYRIRVEGDPADNIEKSIDCYKAALEVTPAEETEQRAIILGNLGIAYRNRINGDPMKNIEDAISYLTKATATFGEGSIIWARARMNLGNAYRNRLPRGNDKNLNSAIDAYNSAITVFDKEQMHLDLGKTWLNLGIAYSDRQDGDGSCKLKAIDAYTFAIKNLDRTFAKDLLGLAWMHLGTVYWERRDFDNASIKKAISAYIEALKVLKPNSMPFFWATTQMNLAAAYRDDPFGDEDEKKRKAVEGYREALGVSALRRQPNEYCNAALSLGDLLFEGNRWEDALDAYKKAAEISDEIYRSSLITSSREDQLTRIADLHIKMAYASAMSENHDCLHDAIVFIERGRARWLSSMLSLEQAELEILRSIRPDLFDQYVKLSKQNQDLEGEEDDLMRDTDEMVPQKLASLAQRKEIVVKRIDEVIDCIRRVPQMENFLRQIEWDDIDEMERVYEESPVIYILTTSEGSLALILSYEGKNLGKGSATHVSPIWLNDFKKSDLDDLMKKWSDGYRKIHTDYPVWYSALDDITKALWHPLMGPIVKALEERRFERATLIPTGLLAWLPLHAVWTNKGGRQEHVLEKIILAYAPSIYLLSTARRRANVKRTDLVIAVKGTDLIKESEEEIDALGDALGMNNVRILNESVSTKEILEMLPGTFIAHFSCHGVFKRGAVRESYLMLSEDKRIKLSDILRLTSVTSRLAVLSACEVGLVDGKFPDEAISFPSAFLKAGFIGTIAPLWIVGQEATANLMHHFYRFLLKDGKDPATALRDAQVLMSHDEKWSHPFHWAGFYLTGV